MKKDAIITCAGPPAYAGAAMGLIRNWPEPNMKEFGAPGQLISPIYSPSIQRIYPLQLNKFFSKTKAYFHKYTTKYYLEY